MHGRRASVWGPARVRRAPITEIRRPNPPRPALRQTTVGDVAIFSDTQGGRAFPPTMDARLLSGFPRMVYRSVHVAMDLRKEGNSALIRLEGATSRAHTAPKDDAAQRAKMCFSGLCTRATRVAIPPIYALGAFDTLKSRGMAFWRAHGPWRMRDRLPAAMRATMGS